MAPPSLPKRAVAILGNSETGVRAHPPALLPLPRFGVALRLICLLPWKKAHVFSREKPHFLTYCGANMSTYICLPAIFHTHSSYN